MNDSALPVAATLGSATMAVLKISGLRLVMSQREMRAVEAVADMDLLDPATNSVGWISHQEQPWPVYCLDGWLTLLREIPPQRRACVLLEWSGGYVGLLCDDVSVIKQLEGRRYALPPAMALPDSPIQGLLSQAEGLACMVDASRLTAYILRLALD